MRAAVQAASQNPAACLQKPPLAWQGRRDVSRVVEPLRFGGSYAYHLLAMAASPQLADVVLQQALHSLPGDVTSLPARTSAGTNCGGTQAMQSTQAGGATQQDLDVWCEQVCTGPLT